MGAKRAEGPRARARRRWGGRVWMMKDLRSRSWEGEG